MDDRNYLMHIWATNNPTLSEETLSMGLYFFRHHFGDDGGSDYQYVIFDTVKDRIFAEVNILGNARERLNHQRDILHQQWSEINKESESPASPEGPDEIREDRPRPHT